MNRKATVAAGSSGWLVLTLDKLWSYLSPDPIAVLQAQYSEGLRIIAEACR